MIALRHALRSLARSPGFVAVAVLALGLGLGLSTTMFAVLDAVVNPFVPYRDPDQLYYAFWRYDPRSGQLPHGLLYAAVQDAQSFSAVVPVSIKRLALETADDFQDVSVGMVSPPFFAVTGARPVRGRAFVESDGDEAVILSDALWRKVFGRRHSLAGATVTLGGRTRTVIGVMPRGAVLPFQVSAWLPLSASELADHPTPFVRLRDGVNEADAKAELKLIAGRLTATYPSPGYPIELTVMAARERTEEIRDVQKAMVAAALSVLLIACANLAQLMLVRGLSKRRELALRMALGATRATVVRQMFTECAIITIAGAALGAMAAWWGADVLTNRVTPQVSWIGLVQPQLSWRVFALGALAAAASAVLFGLLPAIRVALGVNLDEPLKDGSGATARTRQRYSLLVIAEVALALALVMGGGLLLRTIQELRRVQFTFDASTLLRATVGTYWVGRADSSRALRMSSLMTLAASVPGVKDLAFSTYRRTPGGMTAEPMAGDTTRRLQGGPEFVSWRYLRVHGLAIMKGRDFEPGDSDVAIVDAIAAQRLYLHDDPVGRMIELGAPGERNAPWIRIIGVARTPMAVAGGEPQMHVEPLVWVVTRDRRVMDGTLLVRTAGADPRVAVALRRVLQSVPHAYLSVAPYSAARDEALASRGFLADVFVLMGTIALFLAALGLYGVLAYAVSQRMREFAVRIALGAEPRRLLRMVMHDAVVMLLAGIGVGSFLALATTKLLDSVLTTVPPSDVISLVAAECVLMSVGLVAALGPALRAVRANPLDILRAI